MVAPTVEQTVTWDIAAAALTALLPAGVTSYRKGAVPGADGNSGTLPAKFVTLHLERRYLPPSHGSRLRSRSGWRAIARAVANTTRNADALLDDCSGIEDQRLTVEGRRSTPVEFESGVPAAPDDGKFSGSLTWTFTF
jgi:hypothetical protein